ncbi:phytoene desaturase [Flavipsychrobacter stenotrophus]|uniref:Phytoene desaturase n=1 Tax=Flavipsychrobacter stenotrophus TaxID=2077091 RepID=A0A2S7T112_9BACT|nr:phytoene desaturase family protein [Flavipsychrobacter stenotrophus]PQJ12505.1 phytoene desaturase [Flavipsychrobacter stenotrophus]
MSRVSIIGSGFAGLSAACFMAKAGHDVTVFEKNDTIGGRARAFAAEGFTFDMGPSWYWMPDIFEQFFSEFGKKPSDYYNLVQLDPGFQMIFGENETLKIPASYTELCAEFELIEPGSTPSLNKFLEEAKYKYDVGMKKMVYKPSFSWLEFASVEVITGAARLQMFKSMRSHVRSHFKDPRLIALMEFPVLFLGAMAQDIPALYSMMNYAALSMGTFYPMGGMVEIINAMQKLATELGVKFKTNSEIEKINIEGKQAGSLSMANGVEVTDAIIASGDYHHIEQKLLAQEFRNYDEDYWDKKTFAPSSLIFYLGVNKKIKKLIHHNLFFDTSLDDHAQEIYDHPQWPSKPLFYVCCPSKTDDSVAPSGMENLFILMPIALGLKDTDELREQYFKIIMDRLEHLTGDSILPHIVYKKNYCINDFVSDYNAYKGNAYGFANTLRQTAVLKPTLRNKKVKNLFYAGQLTVPGPGVPPSLISGQLAAEQLIKYFKSTTS